MARDCRALLSRRFRGPVSGAERLGFGLSAAALATLVDREKRSDADGEADGRPTALRYLGTSVPT